jgi:hypothetical protein
MSLLSLPASPKHTPGLFLIRGERQREETARYLGSQGGSAGRSQRLLPPLGHPLGELLLPDLAIPQRVLRLPSLSSAATFTNHNRGSLLRLHVQEGYLLSASTTSSAPKPTGTLRTSAPPRSRPRWPGI